MDKLLGLSCFQPHYLSDIMDNDAAAPQQEFRSWENWNTRTQPTVQYVGLENSKKNKNPKPVQDDDDDDEGDGDGDGFGSSVFRRSMVFDGKDAEKMDSIVEEDGVRRSLRDGVPSANLSSSASNRASMTYHQRPVSLDEYRRMGDNLDEYCVFHSDRAIGIHDYMFICLSLPNHRKYESYHAYPTTLKEQALQKTSEYECRGEGKDPQIGADKPDYIQYLAKSHMEDTIESVSCATEQEEMQATFSIAVGEKRYDRDTSGCVLIQLDENKEEIDLLDKYLHFDSNTSS